MRIVSLVGMLVLVAACGGQRAELGGTAGTDAGGPESGRDGGGSGVGQDGAGGGTSVGDGATGVSVPNKCQGSGAREDAGASSGPEVTCSSSSDCGAGEICIVLLGTQGQDAAPTSSGHCGAPCQSDCDCPAWLTCQGGVCGNCTTCPAGERCLWVTPPSAECSVNADCGLGGYCDWGNCAPIQVCVECVGGGCAGCTANSQCSSGEVCAQGTCQACTSDSQCGPSAKCDATHTAIQCTCSASTDCAAGESCSSGVCGSSGLTACESGLPGSTCPTGQVCMNGSCGACRSFEDCNTNPNAGPGSLKGLACVGGSCTACNSNSQCGGGQACVGGTCGTCAADSQCGSSGQCTNGYCTCTSDAQCSTGQRCGSGVCVEM
jgi:Cys-rich repeat protein